MKTEAYINKIIEETGLNRKDINKLMDEKKSELKGLISEEGALFIIAKELGVDVKDENRELLKDIEINISDITKNMKNITLIGRIKEIYDVRKFNKKDGGTGLVGSFLLHDNSGDIRITLWDEQTKILENPNFDTNELVKILNGNAKDGRFGGIEIHVGRFGKIALSPDDVDYKKYPKIKFTAINIREIDLNLKSLSIEGNVIQKSSVREFTRKDGNLGKVGSLTILDSTGSVRVTFWNEYTEKLDEIQTDDMVLITNLTPKLSTLNSKTIELNASRASNIKKISKKFQIEGELIESIELLQSRNGIVSFQGILKTIDNLKAVTLKSGENTNLLSFVVSDDTDGIRVTLWGEEAEIYSKKLSVGKGLILKNVLLKYSNFSKRNEISLINNSSLESIDLSIKELKDIEIPKKNSEAKYSGNYTKIDSINSSDFLEIKGFIVKELNNINIYEACTNCYKKIDNCTCGNSESTEHRMILNLIIDDGTGTIRTTLVGERAEKILGVKTEKIIQIKDTPDFEKFLEKKSAELLGKDIIIRGKTRFSDYSNSYELSVYDFKSVDVDEELETIIKEIEN